MQMVFWKRSVQTGKNAFWSCCCLPVTLRIIVLQTCLRGLNLTGRAVCHFDQIAPRPRPSTTITAATADLAYFPVLCLLCKLYIHSLVGKLLFMQVPFVAVGPLQQLHPLSFGEGISLDPLPPKEIRWVGPGCYFCVGPEDMCQEMNLA